MSAVCRQESPITDAIIKDLVERLKHDAMQLKHILQETTSQRLDTVTCDNTSMERLRLSLIKAITIMSMRQAGRSLRDYLSSAVQFHDEQERWFLRLELDKAGNDRFCIESFIHGCDSDADSRHLTRKFCGPQFSWNRLRVLVHLMIYEARRPFIDRSIAKANVP